MSMIERRQDAIERACRGNPILGAELAPFLDRGEWSDDGDGVVTATVDADGVGRILEIERIDRTLELRIGRTEFPERKRIPIAV